MQYFTDSRDVRHKDAHALYSRKIYANWAHLCGTGSKNHINVLHRGFIHLSWHHNDFFSLFPSFFLLPNQLMVSNSQESSRLGFSFCPLEKVNGLFEWRNFTWESRALKCGRSLMNYLLACIPLGKPWLLHKPVEILKHALIHTDCWQKGFLPSQASFSKTNESSCNLLVNPSGPC